MRGLLVPIMILFYRKLTNDYMHLEAEGMKRAAESCGRAMTRGRQRGPGTARSPDGSPAASGGSSAACVARAVKRFRPGPSASERALRKRLRRQGASFQPRRPARIWREWPDTALRTHVQVERAMAEIAACGLPPHPERTKNWDLLIALGLILERTSTRGAVLEMGSTQYSKLLAWLYLYGYRSLVGIDLVYDEPAWPIRSSTSRWT